MNGGCLIWGDLALCLKGQHICTRVEMWSEKSAEAVVPRAGRKSGRAEQRTRAKGTMGLKGATPQMSGELELPLGVEGATLEDERSEEY